MIDWTPGYSQAGNYLLHVTATDNGDGTGVPLTANVDVPLTISNANRPPEVAPIANKSVDRGQTLTVNVSANDADGDPIVLSASGLPHFASLVDHGDGTGTITFNPGPNDRGNYPITVSATDNGDGGGPKAALSGTASFVLTANAPNEAPKLAVIGDKVAIIGQPISFTVKASDLDQDPLIFSALGLPTGATLTPSPIYGQAIFSWTPAVADAGTYTITFHVSDSGNGVSANVASDERTIHLAVRAVNTSPVLAPVTSRQIAEDQTLAIQLQAIDPDGDPLTYDATNLPAGAAFDPATGMFTWTPTLFQAGLYAGIQFSATDGNRAVSETISITVTNTNQAPVLTPLVPQSGRENTQLQFTVVATDIDVESVVLSAAGLPVGSRFDANTGQFLWTPDFTQAGDYTLLFTATDPGGLSDSISVLVHIDNVDRAPTLEVSSHSVVLASTLAFTLAGADPDAGDTLHYSAAGLPQGSVLDPDTGSFRWTPGPGQAGEYAVTFSVSDGESVTSRRSSTCRTSRPIRARLRQSTPRLTTRHRPVAS